MNQNLCPSCNNPVAPGSIFCDNCGMDLRNVSASGMPAASPVSPPPTPGVGSNCTACGAYNAPGAAFCESCGASLQHQVSLPTQLAQPPEYAAPPAPPVPAYPVAAGGSPCPICGYPNVDGASFCEQCGNPLGQAAPIPAPMPPVPAPVPPAPTPVPPIPVPSSFVSGRLVIQGSNTSLTFPQGKTEVIIGREDPVSGIFPEINLDPHGGHDAGVGRQHAKILASGGRLSIIDMNSVNGTFVNRQKLNPNQPAPLNDGDEIRFGRMVAIYYAS